MTWTIRVVYTDNTGKTEKQIACQQVIYDDMIYLDADVRTCLFEEMLAEIEDKLKQKNLD